MEDFNGTLLLISLFLVIFFGYATGALRGPRVKKNEHQNPNDQSAQKRLDRASLS